MTVGFRLSTFSILYYHLRDRASDDSHKKTVPPGTIRLGRFAQNFEREFSHNITGTVRSKFNLLGQFTLFNFQKEQQTFEVEFSSFLNE